MTLFPIAGLAANIVVGLVVVAAAGIAGVAAFFFIRAKNREALDPMLSGGEGPTGLSEIRELSANIQDIVTAQQDNGETQRAHLSRKIDAMRESVESQHHAVTGLRTELRHEVRRRDAEMAEMRTQIAGIAEGRALGPGEAPKALPAAALGAPESEGPMIPLALDVASGDAAPDAGAPSADGIEEARFEEVVFEDDAPRAETSPTETTAPAAPDAAAPEAAPEASASEPSVFEAFTFEEEDAEAPTPEWAEAPETTPVSEEAPEAPSVFEAFTFEEDEEAGAVAAGLTEPLAETALEGVEAASPFAAMSFEEAVPAAAPLAGEGGAEPPAAPSPFAPMAFDEAEPAEDDAPIANPLAPEAPGAWISRPERETIGGVDVERVGDVPPASGAAPPADEFPEPVVADELATEMSFDFGVDLESDDPPFTFEEAAFEEATFAEAEPEAPASEDAAPEGPASGDSAFDAPTTFEPASFEPALFSGAAHGDGLAGDGFVGDVPETQAPPALSFEEAPTASEPAAPEPAAPPPAPEDDPDAANAPAPDPPPRYATELKTVSLSDLVSAPPTSGDTPEPAMRQAPAPEAPAPEAPAPEAPAPEPAPEAPASARPDGADDLTVISTIDVHVQQALYDAGVLTLDEIARWGRTDARRVASQVGVSADTLMHQWVFEAQSALFDRHSGK